MSLVTSGCFCGPVCPSTTSAVPRSFGQPAPLSLSSPRSFNTSHPLNSKLTSTVTVRSMAAHHLEARAWLGGGSCSPPTPPSQPVLLSPSAGPDCHGPQHQVRDVVCQGYVGQGARSAREYHECDFDWHEHAAAVRHIVEAQQAQARELRQQQQAEATSGSTAGTQPAPNEDKQLLEREAQPVVLQGGAKANTPESGEDVTAAAVAATATVLTNAATTASRQVSTLPTVPGACVHADAAGPHPAEQRQAARGDSNTSTSDSSFPGRKSRSTSTSSNGSGGGTGTQAEPRRAGGDARGVYEGERWEEFYRAHPTARFFKERRYLLLEFPELLQAQHVAEIGCGCGSSILPVLKANAAARSTCTDISVTCLAQLHEAATAEGIAPARIRAFPADAADPAAAPAFDGIDADALLIMFTLSAVTPEQQLVMLSHAWRALRPGGRLMLRDHGLYDMVQLRIPASQWVGPNLYKRGDGTMAFFFSTEELSRRAAAAGFRTVECKYVTVTNRNRKTGVELRRVFIHGVFEKPTSI